MQENDFVIIDPLILEDTSVQSNHHILKRIIEQKEKGRILKLDTDKSKELKANQYWVKFHIAAIRIDEKYLVEPEE